MIKFRIENLECRIMMIRKILLLAAVGVGLFACKDDEEIGFDVPVEFRKELSFRPIPGGSVMNYYLPANSDIFGVRVRYNDARNMPVVKEGTYLTDTLQLLGFNEARQGVTAQLTFFNNQMAESEPMEISFDTYDSAPVAFFDSLTVTPFWGGFSVSYRSPETVQGMAHVFYIGTNPLTHQPDSILMASTPIVEGGDTLNFVLQQKQESTTVVVRTEDYRGYRVKQEIFPDLPCLYMDTLTPADFDFRFTGDVVENEEYQLGTKYLFDGDTKGMTYHRNALNGYNYQYATFVAGPNAFYNDVAPSENRFIVDLREAKIPAAINIYAFLKYDTNWPFSGPATVDYPPLLIDIWNGSYKKSLPCKVKLYGTNENPETVDLSSCALLYELDDDPEYNAWTQSWCVKTDEYFGPNHDESYESATDEDIEKAEPVVLEMLCNYSEATYRYLIFVVTDTYHSYGSGGQGDEANQREYITFNELEVFVKAE